MIPFSPSFLSNPFSVFSLPPTSPNCTLILHSSAPPPSCLPLSFFSLHLYFPLSSSLSVALGRNQPLKRERPKWKSDYPMTEGQLRSKRDEFWDTAPAFEGRKEIWDALRAAASAFESNDHLLAQAILDGASITLPHGNTHLHVNSGRLGRQCLLLLPMKYQLWELYVYYCSWWLSDLLFPYSYYTQELNCREIVWRVNAYRRLQFCFLCLFSFSLSFSFSFSFFIFSFGQCCL